MASDFSADQWGLILGGSSGFGLATAQKLAQKGMSVCIVHRDRRASLAKIEPEFEKIRAGGARLLTFNTDALDAERRTAVLGELAEVAARYRDELVVVAAAGLQAGGEPDACRRSGRRDPSPGAVAQ